MTDPSVEQSELVAALALAAQRVAAARAELVAARAALREAVRAGCGRLPMSTIARYVDDEV